MQELDVRCYISKTSDVYTCQIIIELLKTLDIVNLLVNFHRVLCNRDSMTGNKGVTFISYSNPFNVGSFVNDQLIC